MRKEEIDLLLLKVAGGDDAAFETLVDAYRPLLLSVSSSFDATARDEGIGSIFSDLNQELTLALYRAAVTFDRTQDKVTFGSYAKRCLRNCAIAALRRSRSAARRYEKAKSTLKKEQKSGMSFYDGVSRDAGAVLVFAKTVLSPYEYGIFVKYIEGMAVGEIASELGRDAKSVSNAVYRCKAKVKRLYLDRDRK